jgi:hypothetical protein
MSSRKEGFTQGQRVGPKERRPIMAGVKKKAPSGFRAPEVLKGELYKKH